MIDQINLTNFKGFPSLELHPKQITVFVGPNGSGKSSVLQAFALLKQTMELPRQSPGLLTAGPLVDLPPLQEIATHDTKDKVTLAFNGTDPLTETLPPFQCQVDFSSQAKPIAPIALPPQKGEEITLKELRILPAHRGFIKSCYPLGDRLDADLTMQSETEDKAAQAATNLVYSPGQAKRISGTLKKIFGVGLKAEPIPSKKIEVKSTARGKKINLTAEGFGINSQVMLLQQLTTAAPGATIMIEEPEIHLHPKAQLGIAEELANIALQDNKQLFLTTHSEHIITRLLTMVAEKSLNPSQLAIYSFAKDPETGYCSAQPMEIGVTGSLRGGLPDFFDANMEELNRYVEAQFAQINAAA